MILLSAGGYIIMFRCCQVNCNYPDRYGTQTIMGTEILMVIHNHERME